MAGAAKLAVDGRTGADTVRFRRRGLSRGPHRLVISVAGRTASVLPFRVLRWVLLSAREQDGGRRERVPSPTSSSLLPLGARGGCVNPQLRQRAALDLTHPLIAQAEPRAHLAQRQLLAEAGAQHGAFALGEAGQQGVQLVGLDGV